MARCVIEVETWWPAIDGRDNGVLAPVHPPVVVPAPLQHDHHSTGVAFWTFARQCFAVDAGSVRKITARLPLGNLLEIMYQRNGWDMRMLEAM